MAFAYWNGKGLLSQGWYPIQVEKCREIMVAQNYNGLVYVYGMYNIGEKEWGKGLRYFCVDIVNVFNIPDSDKVICNGNNQKRVPMTEFFVSPGINNYSFVD